MILIQHIEIGWGKDSRGPEAGARRKALPREFLFHPPRENEPGWLHAIGMKDVADYVPQDRWQPLPLKHYGIRAEPQGDFAEIVVSPGRNGFYLQKPSRPNLNGLIARLPLGQRLVLRVNTAIDGHHQRWYVDHTIHIGFAESATLDLPLFREIDERADLY